MVMRMDKKFKFIFFGTLFILLMFNIVSCQKVDNKYEETQTKMGTVMTIRAYGAGAKKAVTKAFERIDEIDRLASLNIEDSEVNKINNAAGKEFVRVHPEIVGLIKKSIEYSKLSNGAFDITIGPLVKLWGIGTQNEKIPSPEEIKEKLLLVGYEKIKINENDSSIMLSEKGMSIDLGGIAKGYAADEAAKILIDNGVKSAFVNLGSSSFYLIGKKPDNTEWKIGMQHPRKKQGEGFLGIIKGYDTAVSTSGDYERYFFDKYGKRYHHILNPKTGYPADSGVMSDTILSDSSMDGDALSTIVFILGAEEGLKLVESLNNVEAVISTSDYRIMTSSNLAGKIESVSGDFKYDEKGR